MSKIAYNVYVEGEIWGTSTTLSGAMEYCIELRKNGRDAYVESHEI